MDYYEPLVKDGYEWVNCVKADDYEVFYQLDGSPQGNNWTPISMRRVEWNEGKTYSPSDFPWLGSHVLIMRRRAVEALHDLLARAGEILPLATDDDVALFALNCQVIYALDEGASTILRFPNTDDIMQLIKPSFVLSAVQDLDIFRIGTRALPTYVSQRFVDRVGEAGLIGLEFERVWSSD